MSEPADLIAEARQAVTVTRYLVSRVSGIPIGPWIDRVERLADALESAAADQMRRDAEVLDEMASRFVTKETDYSSTVSFVRGCRGALRSARDRLRALADEAGRGGGA